MVYVIVNKMDQREYNAMLKAMLYSIIAEFLEQKPQFVPRLARRIIPVVVNEKMSEEKKYEVVQRIYYEFFPEDQIL